MHKGILRTTAGEEWASKWLDAVASGGSAMSQRALSSIERQGGSIELIRRLAKQRSVHLVQLTDDKGRALVAASRMPFKIIC